MPVLFRRQIFQGFVQSLAVVFYQPALCHFSCFVQFSEQIKTTISIWCVQLDLLMKASCVSISGLINLSCMPYFSDYGASASKAIIRAFIYSHFQRLAAAYYYTVWCPHGMLSRDVQVDFSRQSFTFKIIHLV